MKEGSPLLLLDLAKELLTDDENGYHPNDAYERKARTARYWRGALFVACFLVIVLLLGNAGVRSLLSRLHALEKALEGTEQRCSPFLIEEESVFRYSGCGRHVYRGSTISQDRCFDGSVRFYNVSMSSYGGLYDMQIETDGLSLSWHFSCVLTGEATKRAECVLTYEQPLEASGEGPGFITMSFQTDSDCVAKSCTIINSFPYDALTNNAGIYAFFASSS